MKSWSQLLALPLSPLHRLYIGIFGYPVSGLRIRMRRILPWIVGDFKRIADVGCGRGAFAFAMASRFPQAQILGIDLDSRQIGINQNIAVLASLTNLRFEDGDLRTLPYENEFDFVLSVDNLEHIQEDEAAIAHLYKILKPGGVLLCHVPAMKRVYFPNRYDLNFDVPGHVRPGYDSADLLQKLQRAGFAISQMTFTFGWLETISNNISYKITGAKEENVWLYALLFPLLNFMAWLGRTQSSGTRGAGILVRAIKK